MTEPKCNTCGGSEKAHRKIMKKILELEGVTEVYRTEEASG